MSNLCSHGFGIIFFFVSYNKHENNQYSRPRFHNSSDILSHQLINKKLIECVGIERMSPAPGCSAPAAASVFAPAHSRAPHSASPRCHGNLGLVGPIASAANVETFSVFDIFILQSCENLSSFNKTWRSRFFENNFTIPALQHNVNKYPVAQNVLHCLQGP